MASLLGLSRAAFEDAKEWSKHALWLELAMLAAGVGTILLLGPQAYWLAVFTLVAGTALWLLRRRAAATFALAERLRRCALIVDSMGTSVEPFEQAELARVARARWERKTAALGDPDYYASRLPAGPGRLRENLQESAFYSRDLYMIAAKRAWLQVIAAGGLSVVALLGAIQVMDADLRLAMARGLILVLGSAWTLNRAERALCWQDTSSLLEQIDRRLDRPGSEEIAVLLAAVGDYAGLVAAAPAIPTDIYLGRRAKLEALWRDRTGANGVPPVGHPRGQ